MTAYPPLFYAWMVKFTLRGIDADVNIYFTVRRELYKSWRMKDFYLNSEGDNVMISEAALAAEDA
jgi:hypothetical protein